MQPFVISFFPSDAFQGCWRWLYRIASVFGSCLLTFMYGCSVVFHGTHDKYPTILWGGVRLPEWLVLAGIGLWATGAVAVVRPIRYAIQILLVGGVVLSLLLIFDGTIGLISKMCTYCLLLSIVWIFEPYLDPSVPPRPAPMSSITMSGHLSKSRSDVLIVARSEPLLNQSSV